MNRYDDISAFRGFFSMVDPRKNFMVESFMQSFFFLVSINSITPRLILRKNMGERSFSGFQFFLSMLVYIIIGTVLYFVICETFFIRQETSLSDQTGIQYWKFLFHYVLIILVNPLVIFFLIVLHQVYRHYKAFHNRRDQIKNEYSAFRGDSIFFEELKHKFGLSDSQIRVFIEPSFLLSISLINSLFCFLLLKIRTQLLSSFQSELTILDTPFVGLFTLSLIFCFNSICLFAEEIYEELSIRNRALDLIDGEAYMQIVLETKNSIIEKNVEEKKINSNETEIIFPSI